MKPANLCIMCKCSRMLCGLKRCPLLARAALPAVGEQFFGPSTSVFVGRFGYPDVFIGPLGATSDISADEPAKWFGMDYSDIIAMRSSLLRSKQKQNIFSSSRLVGQVQELALAEPTDVEMSFTKKPVYRISFSDIVQ